jgi:hypothetical protein
MNLFRFLVNLGLKPYGVTVQSISIELTRTDPGVLLYKICVDLKGADSYQNDSAWVMANFAVRMLLQAELRHAKKETLVAAMKLMEEMELVEPLTAPRKVSPIIAGRDLRLVPYMTLKVLKLVDELAASIGFLRDTLYSRLIGEPGDRFFICADEVWYQTNIQQPGQIKVQSQTKLMQVGQGLPSAKGGSFAGVTYAALMTADEALLSLPLVGPAYRWAMDHIKAVVIIVGFSLLLTAALIVAFGSGGTTLPVFLPIAEEALSAAAAAAGAGSGEMTVGIMAASGAAAETTVVSAVGSAEIATGTGEVNQLVQWARLAMKAGQTAAELEGAAAQTLADEILIKALQENAVKTALKSTALLSPRVIGLGTGATLIGLSTSPAYAYTGEASGKLSTQHFGELLQVNIGSLYLLKVPKALPTQIPAIPELYKPFKPSDYKTAIAVSADQAPKSDKAFYMLGCFDVV